MRGFSIFSILYIVIAASAAQAEKLRNLSPLKEELAIALGHQNRVTPMEGAGAHGTAGWRLGVGITDVPMSDASIKLMHDELKSSFEPARVPIPKVWMTKGLFYPLDFGLEAASSITLPYGHLGGYAQWTLFEEFRLPAIAVRTSFEYLYGAKDLDLRTRSIGMTTSWGYAFLMAYCDLSLHDHEAHLVDQLARRDSYGIWEPGPGKTQVSWKETTLDAGINVQIAPPFWQIGVSVGMSDLRPPSYQTKLSVGI